MMLRISTFIIIFTLTYGCGGSSSGSDLTFDIDGDGVEDSLDAFPQNSAEAYDTDNDTIGNNADTDDDNDGVPDTSDAFPLDDSESLDTDGDGMGDNVDPDLDNDGIADEIDTDSDNDGVDDLVDLFPLDASETADTDQDGIGNNADPDDDGDGIADSEDALPLIYNALPTVVVTNAQTLNEKSNYLITAQGDDADGPVTYLWSQVSGLALQLEQVATQTVSITTPAVVQDEQAVINITVTDTDGLIASESITLTISVNTPPDITVSSINLTGIVGERFSFDASATQDQDNDVLGYLWNLDAFPGISGDLLSAPTSPVNILSTDIYGIYQLTLSVTDGIEMSSQQFTVEVVPARFGTARFGNHAWSLTQ